MHSEDEEFRLKLSICRDIHSDSVRRILGRGYYDRILNSERELINEANSPPISRVKTDSSNSNNSSLTSKSNEGLDNSKKFTSVLTLTEVFICCDQDKKNSSKSSPVDYKSAQHKSNNAGSGAHSPPKLIRHSSAGTMNSFGMFRPTSQMSNPIDILHSMSIDSSYTNVSQFVSINSQAPINTKELATIESRPIKQDTSLSYFPSIDSPLNTSVDDSPTLIFPSESVDSSEGTPMILSREESLSSLVSEIVGRDKTMAPLAAKRNANIDKMIIDAAGKNSLGKVSIYSPRQQQYRDTSNNSTQRNTLISSTYSSPDKMASPTGVNRNLAMRELNSDLVLSDDLAQDTTTTLASSSSSSSLPQQNPSRPTLLERRFNAQHPNAMNLNSSKISFPAKQLLKAQNSYTPVPLKRLSREEMLEYRLLLAHKTLQMITSNSAS